MKFYSHCCILTLCFLWSLVTAGPQAGFIILGSTTLLAFYLVIIQTYMKVRRILQRVFSTLLHKCTNHMNFTMVVFIINALCLSHLRANSVHHVLLSLNTSISIS